MYRHEILNKVGPAFSEFEILTRTNIDRLFFIYDSLEALQSRSEVGRDERKGQVTVNAMRWDDLKDPKILYGSVKGSQGNNYNPRITFAPKRGYWCDCRDSQSRGQKVGPCKHVLALREKVLKEEIEPRVENVETALELILEKFNSLALASEF